jgi:hypothetical protein
MPINKFTRRERAFDLCNLMMTITVIALSALFFLSFQELTPVTTSIADLKELGGSLARGSCSFGSASDSQLLRVDNTSILFLSKVDASINSLMNVTRADIVAVPVNVMPCTTFVGKRLYQVTDASVGRYKVVKGPSAQRPGELCGGFVFQKRSYNYFGYFRISTDISESYLLESTTTIDVDAPEGITVSSFIFQTVSGPQVDINSNIDTIAYFTDLVSIKLPEIAFSCQYRPSFSTVPTSFGLNLATTLVAVLCLFVQLAYLQYKYMNKGATHPDSALW